MQNIAKHQTLSWSQLTESKSPIVQLFISGIQEAYWFENHLVRVLLKLTNAAASSDLKRVLDHHLECTKIHATKLEHVFELVDETIEAHKSVSVDALSKEASEAIEYTEEDTATRDLAIILACQKIEQYEIATYNGLIKLAVTIGREDVADLLAEIIDDETDCNELLLNQSEIITMRAVEEN